MIDVNKTNIKQLFFIFLHQCLTLNNKLKYLKKVILENIIIRLRMLSQFKIKAMLL